jgi:outer membrane protein assembly factor BamD
MTKNILWMLCCAVILFNGACKSEFEKIRVSGNADLILKKAFEYYEDKKYQKAQTLFELVLSNIRARPDAEKANFQYAYTHYHLKQYLLGAYYFKTFSNTYLNSPQREEAAYLSAYCNYLQSPSHRLDQSASLTAIEEFQTFANLFPDSKRVEECNVLIDELRRKLEKKAFHEGELYYNLRQYQSAVLSFDNLLKDYPESPDVERVRYLIVKSMQQLSGNSVVEKKQERYSETVKRSEEFLSKYNSGKYTKEVREIKKDAEKELKELVKADKAASK